MERFSGRLLGRRYGAGITIASFAPRDKPLAAQVASTKKHAQPLEAMAHVDLSPALLSGLG
jgi:hypothetical protein